MSVLRGYVNQRGSLGAVPHSVQNAVLRDYCHRHGHRYRLAATEVAMERCWTMLDTVVAEIATSNEVDGLLAYGLDALPEDLGHLLALLERVVDHGGEVHFALEGLRVHDHDGIARLGDVFRLRRFVHAARWTDPDPDVDVTG